MKRKALNLVMVFAAFSLLLAACAAPEPEIVEVEVPGPETVVEVEVPVEVEVEVPVGGELVTIVARCRAKPPTEDWRCNNLLFGVAEVNKELEAAGDSRRVVVETIQDNTDFGDIMQEFALAFEAGEAPDIVLTGHEFIGTEATAGRIISIESMISDYPEFAFMIDGLWDSVSFLGERWGIPQDTEARPIYWDKNLLAAVPGWDAARVDGLADEILAGNFTLSDMLDTAEAAVAAGIVDDGKGFWMRPSNGDDFTAVYYASAERQLMPIAAKLSMIQMLVKVFMNSLNVD